MEDNTLDEEIKKYVDENNFNVEFKDIFKAIILCDTTKEYWFNQWQSQQKETKPTGLRWVNCGVDIEKLPLETTLHLHDNNGHKSMGNFYRYNDQIFLSIGRTGTHSEYGVPQDKFHLFEYLDETEETKPVEDNNRHELSQKYNQWLSANNRKDGNYSNTVFDFLFENPKPVSEEGDFKKSIEGDYIFDRNAFSVIYAGNIFIIKKSYNQ